MSRATIKRVQTILFSYQGELSFSSRKIPGGIKKVRLKNFYI